MTDQTPSGNRREPSDPHEREARSVPDAEATASAPAPMTPPPAAAVPEGPGRWRAMLARPGRQGWLAASVSVVVVLVGLGGFLAGRASVDDRAPAEVGQQWRHGDGDGRELPGRPDGAPDAGAGTNS